MQHKGLNQLLCAALINGRFRDTLLRNPARALATGYYDHTFPLTPQERDLVLDIKAQHIEDFAAQVHQWIADNGRSRGYTLGTSGHSGLGRNGNGHKKTPLEALEPFVDSYHAPVPA